MKGIVVLLVLALAALACSSAPSATPTPMPTPTPLRFTNDLQCEANWEYMADGDYELGRVVLTDALGHRDELLPGSVGEYLVICVDEGWRGCFDESGPIGSSGG